MTGFLDLPREHRDQIYVLVLCYPALDALITRANRELEAQHATHRQTESPNPISLTIDYKPLKTPTILLLNHQITSEALPLLQNQTWTLSTPVISGGYMPGFYPKGRIPDLFTFIGKGTLETIRNVILEIDFHSGQGYQTFAWAETAFTLVITWTTANRLEFLRVIVSNFALCEENGDLTHEWRAAHHLVGDLEWMSEAFDVRFECNV